MPKPLGALTAFDYFLRVRAKSAEHASQWVLEFFVGIENNNYLRTWQSMGAALSGPSETYEACFDNEAGDWVRMETEDGESVIVERQSLESTVDKLKKEVARIDKFLQDARLGYLMFDGTRRPYIQADMDHFVELFEKAKAWIVLLKIDATHSQ